MVSQTSQPIQIAGAPRLSAFINDLTAAFPVLARAVSEYLAELRPEPGFPDDAENLFVLTGQLAQALGLSGDDLLDAYADFCLTFLREQDYFLKTGEYRNAARGFEAVRQEVYEDDEYMGHYMFGHLISCSLFPHHFRQYQFFRKSFVAAIAPEGTAFEFGPGHGLWLSTLLSNSHRRGQGCDISPTCVRIAEKMMQVRGIESARVQLGQGDAVRHDLAGKEFDAMIASGLLEHIEDPWAFLRRIRPHLRPGTGRLFTMVPTNTAHPDHLIHFKKVEEIQAMYRDSGFEVKAECILSQGNLGSKSGDADTASLLHLGVLARAA
jgi:2-polyprenyl-3-methyl-5-hydroxy-6-metoxy-1,4-benzoquinol methylase